MSSQTSSYLDEIIALLTFVQTLTPAFLAAITFYIYDTILMFDDELELIWRRKFNFGTILYIFARYGALVILPTSFLLSNVTVIESPKACLITSVISNVFAIPALIGVEGLLVALPYVLYASKKGFLYPYIPLSLICIVCMIIRARYSDVGCEPESPTAQQMEFILKKFLNAFLKRLEKLMDVVTLVFNGLTFLMTCYPVFSMWRSTKTLPFQRRGQSLSMLLIRGGLLRYLCVLLVTFLDTIAQFGTMGSNFAAAIGPFQNALSVILLCRFILDVRRGLIRPEASSGTTVL